MKLTRLTDYAVVILAFLGQKPTSKDVVDSRGFRLVSTVKIADYTGIPSPTCQKILKILTNHGLVKSVCGARGGYALSYPPESTNIAQIITAMEGPIALTACVEGDVRNGYDSESNCNMQNICALSGNWNSVNRAVRQALERVSLIDMTPFFDTLSKTDTA